MRTTLTAQDIMSSPVISVLPSTPVPAIASVMRDHRIGGVPVIAGGHLEGMVTEADLIQRHELGTHRLRDASQWWHRFRRPDATARAYVKSHGRSARHVMSSRVHVVEAQADLAEVASLFRSRHIGRAPVVRGTQVVGIVAQADLVRALANQPRSYSPRADTDDEAIRRLLLAELAGQPWWNGCWENVYVVDGMVLFKGVVENEAYRAAAQVAAENIPGVRGIVDDRVLSAQATELL